ncbi:MAG: hypothetical protein ACRDHX_07545 [Chloroflexota bacterium]
MVEVDAARVLPAAPATGTAGQYAHTGAAFPPERDCPLPNTHRRLEDAHKAWHLAAEAYALPEDFRAHSEAARGALRTCLLMVQRRTRALLDFETWHRCWREAIAGDEVLAWLLQPGRGLLAAQELAGASSAVARLLVADHLPPLAELSVPVSLPTREIALSLTGLDIPRGQSPGRLTIERRWAARGLESWELLEALAYGYAATSTLLQAAHGQGAEVVRAGPMPSFRRPLLGPRPLDCMRVSAAMRTLLLNLRTGRLQGPRSQWIEREEESGDMVARRLGGLRHLQQALARAEQDPLSLTAKYFEDAKRVVARDKAHRETVRLYLPAGHWIDMEQHADNQYNRYSVWMTISQEAARLEARAVMLVCAVPAAAKVESGRLFRAPLPPRREAVVMLVEAWDGRHRTLTAPFQRRGEHIRFGRTHVETDGRRWHQLEPVRELWRR